MSHIPVLLKEAIDFLNCGKRGIYVDGTLGGGGHSYYLTRSTNQKSQIISIDRDQEAIKFGQEKLKEFKNIIFIKDRFENLDKILSNLKIKKIDGVLLDLGPSSYQLENFNRGFSFQEKDNNLRNLLDMRMDQKQLLSAFHIFNNYSEKKIKKVFFQWGEIKQQQSNLLAYSIIKDRQKKSLQTIGDLLKIAEPILRQGRDKKRRYPSQKQTQTPNGESPYYPRRHWATNLFRAIRIEVNQEIEFLEKTIFMITELLNPLGRLVIISFHSLEDRIVKNSFKKMENQGKVKILFKKGLTPTFNETLLNSKARSARLRVIEKL